MQSWKASWKTFWGSMAPMCAYCDSVHARTSWRRLSRRTRGVRLQGARYCRTECLELALIESFGRARSVRRHAEIASHRIPLGLLLLSRGQLTADQLRAALAAQSAAGCGKIGAWLQELGFATESVVTAGLARQWSCPVLRAGSGVIGASQFPPIPALLLESFQMIPVELVETTRTLLIAFSEGIDYTALYAIEHMLGYHTQCCLVLPSTMQNSLQALARQRISDDVIVDRMENAAECAHIIGSYTAKVGAQEIRMARCGKHLWVRLERADKDAINLVLSAPENIHLHLSDSTFVAPPAIASAF